jgi:chemotaxis signal transduction protein
MTRSGADVAQEFAVFSLGSSQFALGVIQVREVLRAAALSLSPASPNIEGLFNLRGNVIPVVDLRSKLNLPVSEIQTSDFLIVFGTDARSAALRTGEPVQLESVGESCIETSSQHGLVMGTIRILEKVVSLLDVEALLDLAGSTKAGIDHTTSQD